MNGLQAIISSQLTSEFERDERAHAMAEEGERPIQVPRKRQPRGSH
jgi:hypothetical protein